MEKKTPVMSCTATPKENDLVLIGVVKRKVDLDHLRKDRWYRIPAHLSFRKSSRYLAVYPTARCGSGGGGISSYSAIQGITRTKRIDLLPDEDAHPRAQDWYWRLQLGPLRKLPHRIENRLRRRVTFAYTTLPKLIQAHEIGELFGIPPLEEIMRRSLLSAGITSTPQFCVMRRKRCLYRVDFAIFCCNGKIALECDHSRWHQRPDRIKRDRERDRWLQKYGWLVIHLTEDNIINHPAESLRYIQDRILSLGGIHPL